MRKGCAWLARTRFGGVGVHGRWRRDPNHGMLAAVAKVKQAEKRTDLFMLPLELIDKVVHQAVVEILATQMSVTGSTLDFEDTLLNGQQGNIKGPSAQIEDEHVSLTLSLLVETVGNGCCGRLVDDTENVEASNETGIFSGLTLRIVEVCWDSDDGVVHGSTQVRFSGLPHLRQDHRGDLLWCERLDFALELHIDNRLGSLLDNLEGEMLHVGLDLRVCELSADETLCIENCVDRIHGDLILGRIANQALGVGEGNEGRGGTISSEHQHEHSGSRGRLVITLDRWQ